MCEKEREREGVVKRGWEEGEGEGGRGRERERERRDRASIECNKIKFTMAFPVNFIVIVQ